MTPPTLSFSLRAIHRLVPSRFSDPEPILAAIVDSQEMLDDLLLLEAATNDRIQGEQQGLIGISTYELVYGISNAHIVNAAFTHANEAGSRFNDHTRGAWYSAEQLETSFAEVIYHKARRLSEIIVPQAVVTRPGEDLTTYDDWLADFQSDFHLLEPAQDFPECLQPEPVPQCYAPSQQMARRLLAMQSNGLVYPSVRHKGSRCLVCFRPALVYHPRRSPERYEIALKSGLAGYEHRVGTLH